MVNDGPVSMGVDKMTIPSPSVLFLLHHKKTSLFHQIYHMFCKIWPSPAQAQGEKQKLCCKHMFIVHIIDIQLTTGHDSHMGLRWLIYHSDTISERQFRILLLHQFLQTTLDINE